MGNSESTVDVYTEVANAVLASITQEGSKITVNQDNNIEGSEFNIDGSDCPNGKVTKVTIGNNVSIDDSVVFSAVAEATATVMQEITNQLNAQNTPITIGDTETSVSNINIVKNKIATDIKSKCSTVNYDQRNTLKNILANVKCATFEITNDASAKLACAVDTAAKTTADITQKIKTEASTSNSLLSGGMSAYIIIAVVIIMMVLMIVMMSSSGGSGGMIVTLILIAIIVIIVIIVIIIIVVKVKKSKSSDSNESK